MENSYKKFEYVGGYNQQAEIDGKTLDGSKLYDIKLPSGKEFFGKEVDIVRNHYQGNGGMDESFSTVKVFFDAGFSTFYFFSCLESVFVVLNVFV